MYFRASACDLQFGTTSIILSPYVMPVKKKKVAKRKPAKKKTAAKRKPAKKKKVAKRKPAKKKTAAKKK